MTAQDTGAAARQSPPTTIRPPRRSVVLTVVALGGGIGAAARYAASLRWPTPGGVFPWTTFWVNAAGCAVIGVFLAAVTEARAAPPLLRPFFGTGVLGGFTTFSTYAVDIERLIEAGHPRAALAYLAATLVAAGAAVWCAVAATRKLIKRRRRVRAGGPL
ncbi:hypothetical protein ADL00_32365 [Streptomyces sp. AS58]|uniref:fluoride efflux transporter CrcB n=1 Tax=Streptomyces TaxID=1883 RepID=UPI0006B0142A|nr:fluoride efflux transporter CrcB [Streptomyces sp. AS58]KOV53875.1 hypothetical protein ADL00_32365 [Streptomyces sp. AS58]